MKDYYIIKKWWKNSWGGIISEVEGYYYATEADIKAKVNAIDDATLNSSNYGFMYERVADIAKEL